MTQPLPFVAIREAVWPDDLAVAHRLLLEYFQTLRENPAVPDAIRYKDRAPELAALSHAHRSGRSTLLLALASGTVVGCALVQLLNGLPHAAELKRLYVQSSARRLGVGRALLCAAAEWARARGAHQLLLDTLPEAMPAAIALYASLGFQPVERYNKNDVSCFAFFRLGLQ